MIFYYVDYGLSNVFVQKVKENKTKYNNQYQLIVLLLITTYLINKGFKFPKDEKKLEGEEFYSIKY